MASPTIAAKAPKPVEVQEGRTYFWCACGKSLNQPYCDGSHRGTDFAPVAFKAKESKTIYFCMCKHTGNQPVCDGAHKKI